MGRSLDFIFVRERESLFLLSEAAYEVPEADGGGRGRVEVVRAVLDVLLLTPEDQVIV